ncbi:hypothetical protein DM02DRAFT_671755 [Periconia macrospinosa]|uniref:NAD-dependent epimerase/dehydratase domain-containing protein n=1 Tax=Periconia macrospinosa TaxID=97972 RepID=A0A2V1DRG5_9PLEO|nr:hypothetical protein DM02DRAFT_671755 [Periconia macrospinosa]
MIRNILITGAGGYIGGSVATKFATQKDGPIKNTKIYAAVRSKDQTKSASIPGLAVLQLDCGDYEAVKDVVLNNHIDMVIHTASSMVASYSQNLLEALGERRKQSGQETGVLTAFTDMGGWRYGQCKDSDAEIFTKEKGIGDVHPTDILIVEQSKALGVKSFILPAPYVYGRGTGDWRKLSVSIPQYIRTSMRLKQVYKFPEDAAPAATHISDLVSLYKLLATKILLGQTPPANENGYYFPFAHRIPWYKTMDLLAKAMHSRGLVNQPHVEIWPSYEKAADEYGFPRQFIRAMGASSGDIVAEKPFELGWKPQWDEKKYLENIDQEVQDFLELDSGKASIFDALTT